MLLSDSCTWEVSHPHLTDEDTRIWQEVLPSAPSWLQGGWSCDYLGKRDTEQTVSVTFLVLWQNQFTKESILALWFQKAKREWWERGTGGQEWWQEQGAESLYPWPGTSGSESKLKQVKSKNSQILLLGRDFLWHLVPKQCHQRGYWVFIYLSQLETFLTWILVVICCLCYDK